MIYIAHRGNLTGPKMFQENSPDYIQKALSSGFYVEIDVWKQDNKLWLGHDGPVYETTLEFLKSNDKMICHAKNILALEELILADIHCFSHDTDDVVLTSRKWLWTYPGKFLTKGSICVMPEINNDNFEGCMGICSDYVQKYKNKSK